eukprot:GHVN01003670.1.p2 GENE.GHVN01003670.1~~GHVN01003670.1.p2  ORF type:complete len:186 (-),score=24.48 GHVN01003670.1:2268-2789(-)
MASTEREKILERVVVISARDLREVTESLQRLSKTTTVEEKFSVIIVDSVASAARLQFNSDGPQSPRARREALNEFIKIVKQLAWRFGCPTVLTNQTNLPQTHKSALQKYEGGGLSSHYGDTWLDNSNVRILLDLKEFEEVRTHLATVIKSAQRKTPVRVQYTIEARGVGFDER